MLELSHLKLKTLLKHRQERVGGRLIECADEHTSKTCSN